MDGAIGLYLDTTLLQKTLKTLTVTQSQTHKCTYKSSPPHTHTYINT